MDGVYDGQNEKRMFAKGKRTRTFVPKVEEDEEEVRPEMAEIG